MITLVKIVKVQHMHKLAFAYQKSTCLTSSDHLHMAFVSNTCAYKRLHCTYIYLEDSLI